MRFPDLIIGEEYILTNRRTATFEGKHEGMLTLADGGTYEGNGNFLRFRTSDGRVVLLENGAAVQESVSAKNAREQAEAELKARREDALAEAVAFLSGLGFTVATRNDDYNVRREMRDRIDGLALTDAYAETADDHDIDEMTVGKLRAMLARVAK